MKYVNTSAGTLIAESPRGTYRVEIARRPLLERTVDLVLSWPSIVRTVLENSAGVAGFPLTPDGTVAAGDSVAVLDYRATTHPGTATVGDLVRQIQASTPYIIVVSITANPPVPALSQGGAATFNATREAEQTAAQEAADAAAAESSLLNRLGGGALDLAKGIRTVAVAGAVIALVIAAVIYLPPKRAS